MLGLPALTGFVASGSWILLLNEPERRQDGTVPSSVFSACCCFGGNIGAWLGTLFVSVGETGLWDTVSSLFALFFFSAEIKWNSENFIQGNDWVDSLNKRETRGISGQCMVVKQKETTVGRGELTVVRQTNGLIRLMRTIGAFGARGVPRVWANLRITFFLARFGICITSTLYPRSMRTKNANYADDA